MKLPNWLSIGLLLLISFNAYPAAAQPWREAEERAKHLVAMVQTDLGEGQQVGAALLVGAESDDIFLVTADHLVRQRGTSATRIEVRFYGLQETPMVAELLTPRSPPNELDLAVVRVPGAARELDLESVPFTQLSPPGELQRGDEVYMLGYPLSKAWRLNINPERVAAVDQTLIDFESNLIRPGHSGGALLDEQRRLAGMLRRDEPPYGEAVQLSQIMRTLVDWGVPVWLALPGPQVVAGGHRTCRLEPDGAVVCWGNYGIPYSYTDPEPASIEPIRFRQISIGAIHTCGLDRDGLAYCWGSNKYGQGGTGEMSDIKRNVTPMVSGAPSFSSISAGGWHSCGLAADGQAYCWGAGSEGRLGNDSGKDSARPVPVAGGLSFRSLNAGYRHTCGLTYSGEAWCWGGALGTGKSRVGIDPDNAFIPMRVADDLRFTSVSAGQIMTCALTREGEVWCWGSSEAAGVGVNAWDMRDRVVPVALSGRIRFKSIDVGLGGHACGVTPSGSAYCWGENETGQLGNGTRSTSFTPVSVAGGMRFSSVRAGEYHSCGITTEGLTCCWGSNRAGAIWPDAGEELTEPLCLDELRYRGKRQIGVRIGNVTPELAESLGLSRAEGALITELAPGGPAVEAGLEAGDVVLEVNGQRVMQLSYLPHLISRAPRGEPLTVTINREGERRTLSVSPQDRALDEPTVAKSHWRDFARPDRPIPPRLGRPDSLDSFDEDDGLGDPQDLVARHLQSLGGVTKLEGVLSRESRGTIEFPLFGLGGDLTVLQKSPDKLLSTIVLKWVDRGRVYKTETHRTGFNGKVGWTEDPEGEVTLLEGPELEALHRDSRLIPELNWTKDRAVPRGHTRLGERPVLAVQTASNQGHTKMLFFDQGSGLLAYSRIDLGRSDGQGQVETYFDDYRSVEGFLVPFSLRVSDSSGTALVDFETIRHGVAIDDEVFAPPKPSQPGQPN